MNVITIRDTVTLHDLDLPEGSVLQDVEPWGARYWRGLYCSMAGSYYEVVKREDCEVVEEEVE